jgi:hypothetical protein
MIRSILAQIKAAGRPPLPLPEGAIVLLLLYVRRFDCYKLIDKMMVATEPGLAVQNFDRFYPCHDGVHIMALSAVHIMALGW